MLAFIKVNDKQDFINVNAYIANEGFTKLGWETVKFFDISGLQNIQKEAVIVSGIQDIRARLHQLNIAYQSDNTDYPMSLKAFFGRKIWQSTLHEILRQPLESPIFIKPKEDLKRFTGRVVANQNDFIGIFAQDDLAIWCSEVINFVTEWRVFVRYQEIIDVRQYKGAWDSRLDLVAVKKAIESYNNPPNAYAIDFGITDTGELNLVEVNEGFSVGSYGMNAIDYAKFLSARWAELTMTEDFAKF